MCEGYRHHVPVLAGTDSSCTHRQSQAYSRPAFFLQPNEMGLLPSHCFSSFLYSCKSFVEPTGHCITAHEHLKLEKERNTQILPSHSQPHTAGIQQNSSLTLLTSRKPYTWQPSFFCSCIFWLNPSLLHCSMVSGFLKAQPRRL